MNSEPNIMKIPLDVVQIPRNTIISISVYLTGNGYSGVGMNRLNEVTVATGVISDGGSNKSVKFTFRDDNRINSGERIPTVYFNVKPINSTQLMID